MFVAVYSSILRQSLLLPVNAKQLISTIHKNAIAYSRHATISVWGFAAHNTCPCEGVQHTTRAEKSKRTGETAHQWRISSFVHGL